MSDLSRDEINKQARGKPDCPVCAATRADHDETKKTLRTFSESISEIAKDRNGLRLKLDRVVEQLRDLQRIAHSSRKHTYGTFTGVQVVIDTNWLKRIDEALAAAAQ